MKLISLSWPLAVFGAVLGLFLDAGLADAQDTKAREKVTPQLDESGSKSTATEKLGFIRQTMQENGEPKALQTAITRFKNRAGATVDLIGAVHIGNAEYYKVLNELFTDYDVVLYELVAPEDQNIPQPGRQSSNPISFLQSSAQKMLGLSSQLEGIDYNPSNFVHADLSPEQMQEKMAERGQTGFSLAMEAFAEMMSNQSNSQNALGESDEMSFNELIETFNSPYKLRRMMAAQFAGEDLEIGLGKSLNQLLVADRNEAAMKVLHSQLEKGHKKIAIFYGAAHMPDFQERMESELEFKFASQSWLDAWDLRKTAADERGSELSPLMQLLDEFSKSIDQ